MTDLSTSIVLIFFTIALLSMVTVYAVCPAMYKEQFTDLMSYPTSQLCTMPLTSTSPLLSGPAAATITEPRVPYHLLGDYMESGPERLSTLKSECKYITDTQRVIEKTGYYGQVTNNYKHKNPDNGSTLLRELSLSFYKL